MRSYTPKCSSVYKQTHTRVGGAIKVYMGKQSILLRMLGHLISQSLLLSVFFIDSMQDLASMRHTHSEVSSVYSFWCTYQRFLLPRRSYQSLPQDEIDKYFSSIRMYLRNTLIISYIQLGQKEKAKEVVSYASYYGFPRT